MDKELLEALNNLSLSLDEISKALKKESTSAVSSALKGGDFSKSLESISKEIVQISKDTTQIKKDQSQIIKSQNTIINMLSDIKSDRGSEVEKKVTSPTTVKEVGKSKEEESKESESKSLFGGASKDSSKIKDGVSTIILIAAGVLAIGMAFKIIGKIDIASVLALSLALPIIAFAFQKISEMKLKSSEIGALVLLTVGMSTAISLSSFILGTIQPVGLFQVLTAILISGVFVGISYGMAKIVDSIRGLGISGAAAVGISFLLPILMVGFSAAIAGSSYFLGMVKPVGLFQAITSILISGVFVGLSYSLAQIVGSLKGVSPATALVAAVISPILLVALSAAIAGASIFIAEVKPVGLFQALTAILIAGVFAAVGWGLNKILTAFKGVGIGTMAAAAIGLPIILIAMSYAIAKSSEFFGEIKPIGIFQALTAILIAATFTVLGFGLGKMIQGFRGVSPATAAVAAVTMPLILIALSYAIKVSSEWLSEVKIIGLFQFLTALGISAIFVALSYSVKPLMRGVQGIGIADVGKGVLVILALTTAVVVASYLISEIKPISISQGLTFVGTSIAVGSGSLIMGLALKGLSKIGKLREFDTGSLSLILVATTVVAVSHIISMGDYSTYPPISWTVGVAASMIPFGLGMVLIGGIASSWVGALAMAAGGLAMVGIALTIVGVSHILKIGDYSTYPPISWTVGVAASMIPFGLGMVVLGPLLPLVTLGVGSTLLVAKTIKWTSEILRDGDYSKYPDLGWSKGTSLALGSFALGMSMLGGVIFATFGIGGQMLEAGSNAVLSVAKTIVSASDILANGYQDDNGNKFRPNYLGGPTKSWAEGIAISLGAFSPIYSMLMKNSVLSLFGVGGIGPEDFTNAIKTVSKGIVSAARFFASPDNPGVWSGYPTKDWAEGVGIAIGAFSPVYDILLKNTGIFKSGVSVDQFVSAIDVISRGLVSAANFFSKNKSPFLEGNYPSKEWGEGVGSALGAFAPIFEILSSSNNMWISRKSISSSDLSNAIVLISSSIVDVSKKFKGGVFRKEDSPSKEWSEGVKKSIEAFGSIFGFISDNSGWFGSDIGEVSNAIIQIGTDITKVSKVLSLGIFDTKIDPKWISSVKLMIDGYIGIVSKIVDFDISDISDSKKTIDLIISSVSSISSKLSSIKFTDIPVKSWVDQMKSTLHTFSNFISGLPKIISKDLISSGMSASFLLLSSVSKMSDILGSINYDNKVPSDEWSASINNFMIRFASIFTKFSKYNKDIIVSGFSNALMVFKAINLISDIKVSYPTVPNGDWIRDFESFISNFGRVILSFSKNFNEGDLVSGGNSISQILKSVGVVSNGFQSISYSNTPPENWISSVEYSIKRFGSLSNYLDSEVSSLGLIGSKLKIGQIISSISDVANQFSSVSFNNFPDTGWIGGLAKSVISVSILMKDVDSRLSILDISVSRDKMLDVSKTIADVGRSFSNLDVKKIDTSWISSISTSITNFSSSIKNVSTLTKSEFSSSKEYLLSMVDIVKDLSIRFSKLNIPNDVFTSITNLTDLFRSVNGLIKMNPIGLTEIDRASSSFDRLSKSIDGLSDSLNNIDSGKLSQISSIKSGSILINLVADDQFNQLIQQIEKSSGIFVEALNNMKKRESPNVKVSGESVSDVKVNSQEDKESLEIQSQILLALKDIQEVIGKGKTVDNYVKEKTNIGSLLRK